MTGVWIATAIIAVIITWLSVWVINKGYSKKWDREEP